MFYRAKIVEKTSGSTYNIMVPSLGINSIEAHLIGPKGSLNDYLVGDLIAAVQFNDQSWGVVGYIFGQRGGQ